MIANTGSEAGIAFVEIPSLAPPSKTHLCSTAMLRSFAPFVAALLLPLTASAGDQFTISPADSEVCVGDDLELDLCSRPGDYGLLLVSKSPGTTVIPGIGTFAIPLDPFPTILELGVVPGNGCFDVKQLVPCDCTPLTYYIQGVSVNPTDMSFLISNPGTVDIKSICQDWDGNGVNDTCDPDCDGDGVIDGLELDSDGDGIPNDCDTEVCVAPEKACDGGCWDLLDKPAGSGGPDGTYGFRLDGLFGDHSDNLYTFSFEHPGTDVQMCHDKASGTITVQGLVYGGLGTAPNWDPNVQGFAELSFTWTGAKCKDKKTVVHKNDGGGSGTFTWLPTGEVVPLGPKADGDGYYAFLDKDLLFHAWVSFPGMPSECCQDFKAQAVGITTCP